MTRLLRLALLALLIAVVCVATAAAGPPDCTRGVSSTGPVVLIDGHVSRDASDLKPHTEACLP